MTRKMTKAERAEYQERFGTETLGSTEYVAFGFNSIDKKVVRLGGYPTLPSAKKVALSTRFLHAGVAKVTHPQMILFRSGGKFAKVNPEVGFDVITLLGV